jgi:hypothetical protein
MMQGNRVRQILELLIEQRVPVIMSFQTGHQWQSARVLFTYIENERFDVKITPKKKNCNPGFQTGQMVGMSFKYGFGSGYDNFIFDTKIVSLFPASGSAMDGDISLVIPEQIEMVQRRNYQRVAVPQRLGKIDVLAWCNVFGQDNKQILQRKDYHFELIDISASGIQIAISSEKKPDFQAGQSIGVKFTAVPNSSQIAFTAAVKNIFPTADGKSICFGLQTVGLEASPEGRLVLQRICSVVEEYKQINAVCK